MHSLPDALRSLPDLLVKAGLALGRLGDSDRQLCLALFWSSLPRGMMTEREVNDALKAVLVLTAFLATDHVELRRWLVDAGWLQRDGYGRAYRAVDVHELPASTRAVATALRDLDVVRLVARVHAAEASRRAARRQAWEARDGGGLS